MTGNVYGGSVYRDGVSKWREPPSNATHVPRCEIILFRAPRLYNEEPSRASMLNRHTSKFKVRLQ